MVNKKIEKKWVEEKDLEYILSKANDELHVLSGYNILLIGAGGFLGYYFIKSILKWNETSSRKINLTALSTFRNGVPDFIKSYAGRKDFKFIKQDIASYNIPLQDKYDYIIQGASIASPIIYRKYPIETINANVFGLYKVLDYAIKRKKIKKDILGLLYFSSSEVYGDPLPENVPTPEDYLGNVSCTGPRACYDESKRFCETLCVNFANVHSLPIKIARPFNNYGPGMKINDGRVIADFSKNIIEGNNIIMFSNGAPSRTFCYVADAIIGYLKILAKGNIADPYNIGVEEPEVTIKKLSQKMIKIAKREFGYKGKLIINKSQDKEYLTDNPQRRCPQIKKAKKDLDYKPEISLDEGLLRTMSWYKGL